MAGIGFRLQALVKRGTYLEATSAYFSATIIFAGPWLTGVVALFALSHTASLYLQPADRDLLGATIVCMYIASLLCSSGPQLLLSRYLADRLYLKDVESLAPTCNGVVCLILPFSLIALPFVAIAPFSVLYCLLVATLFVTLCLIWILMMFLSAARGYVSIIVIVGLSYALGISSSVLLGHRYGVTGSLAGFALGQMLCLCLLIMFIYREFPSRSGISFAYLGYFSRYWDLFTIGVLYTTGIWADSVLFWYSSRGQVIHGYFHLFSPYDTAKFIGYLSTVLASAVFLIHLETSFHVYYQRYYQLIQRKGTLVELVRARQGMASACRAGFLTLLKVQGLIALFLFLVAPALVATVGLAPAWVPLVRIGILSGMVQFFTLVMIVLLLYIDRRRVTLIVAAVFLLSNIALTLLSLSLGNVFFGAGYLGACTIGALIGWFVLNNQFKHLEYLTYMEQPVVIK